MKEYGNTVSSVLLTSKQNPDFFHKPDLMAHSGFLNSAWALDDIVSERIKAYIENAENTNGQKPHVLFTGHSAGGAVATLFYLRYISDKAFGELKSKLNQTLYLQIKMNQQGSLALHLAHQPV